MEVSVQELSTLRRNLNIVLPKEVVAPKMEAAYRKLQGEVSLKGFRKGKVPQKVLVKSFGDRVQHELSEQLIQDTYFDALSEVKLDAVVHPDIKSYNFEEDGSFKYDAEIEIRPQFELAAYKGVEVEEPEIEVGEAEIAAALEQLRKEMAPLRGVEERGIAKGDLVVIDFQGFHNGKPLPQVLGRDHSLDVGSEATAKEFDALVLGLKKGEEASRTLDFPAQFPNPVLAGKSVDFKVTVKEVKERVLAALDDEFAKDVGSEFVTLDALKESIRAKIAHEKEEAQEGDITDKLMYKLIDAHSFELPARLVAYEINDLVKNFEANLERQGHSLAAAGLKPEQLAEQYRETAERRVRGDFILKKVAELENIKLEDKDIEEGFQRIASQYNMAIAEVKKYFTKRDELLPFMQELLNEKILKFLRQEAKVTHLPASQLSAEIPAAEGGEKE